MGGGYRAQTLPAIYLVHHVSRGHVSSQGPGPRVGGVS